MGPTLTDVLPAGLVARTSEIATGGGVLYWYHGM